MHTFLANESGVELTLSAPEACTDDSPVRALALKDCVCITQFISGIKDTNTQRKYMIQCDVHLVVDRGFHVIRFASRRSVQR